jgi:hypothetical protein
MRAPFSVADCPVSEPREQTIRDRLVRHLELLEPGLVAVAIEERLPNLHGAPGFVDILGRDVYGNLVLIELKRSDSAARAAIHELFKYTALVRQNYGLPPDRMRCIVVSTAWRELLVPFSEFARAAAFPVSGFRLTVDADGTPTKADAVRATDEDRELILAPVHWIGCHATREDRQSTISDIVNSFAGIGVPEYLILSVDHDGSNERIIHPFVSYVVLGRVPLELADSLSQRNLLGLADQDDNEEDNASEWHLEEAILSALYGVGSPDSVESGWPEKLLGMLNSAWTVTSIHRHGRIASERIYPNDDVIRLCTQTGSRNAILFSTIVRPEFRARWQKALDDLGYTLEGNSIWKSGTLQYLNEVARSHPTASVAVHVYNPMNLLLHLCLVTRDSEPRYLPELNVVVDDGSNQVRFLFGRLAWNGVRPPDPELIVRDVFGDPSMFILSQTMHMQWQHEEEVARHYGLSYYLLEVALRANAQPVFREFSIGDDVYTWSRVDAPDDSFARFLAHCGDDFKKLAQWLSRYTNL